MIGNLNKKEIIAWLKEDDARRLKRLWEAADTVRREQVGDAVHLRGIIEISNYCRRYCHYCGINAANKQLQRYLMPGDEILEAVGQIENFGYGTVVLQAGEDPRIGADWMAGIIQSIKKETSLAVTLSLGERSKADLKLWKKAGADRYLLKFETSNPALFDKIHPPVNHGWKNRFEILAYLQELGYETGSGVMIGIPGQTYADLAEDLLTFKKLNLDMIGCGPFLAHPDTLLGNAFKERMHDTDQVPNTEMTTYKVMALTRILCPNSNIPTTTALATLNSKNGREQGLKRGANVIMPNVTPVRYRQYYEIYPNRICLREFGQDSDQIIKARIINAERTIAVGKGAALSYIQRNRNNKGRTDK